MRKFIFPVIFFFILTGCPRRMPSIPRREFSGLMDIFYGYRETEDFIRLRANFRADGFRNRFIAVFSDMAGIPRGEVEIINRRIVYSSVEADTDLMHLLEYWPVIFNPARGRQTDALKINEVTILYGEWVETKSGNFPQKVEILSPEFRVYIDIVYGN